MGDVLAVEDDLPAGDAFKPGQAAQQGGLAAAGRPQQGDKLPFVDVEVDFVQDSVFAKLFDDVFKFNISHWLKTSR